MSTHCGRAISDAFLTEEMCLVIIVKNSTYGAWLGADDYVARLLQPEQRVIIGMLAGSTTTSRM